MYRLKRWVIQGDKPVFIVSLSIWKGEKMNQKMSEVWEPQCD